MRWLGEFPDCRDMRWFDGLKCGFCFLQCWFGGFELLFCDRFVFLFNKVWDTHHLHGDNNENDNGENGEDDNNNDEKDTGSDSDNYQ